MNYLKSSSIYREIINNYSISNKDLGLFYDFLTSHGFYFSNDLHKYSTEYIVSEWSKFLQNNRQLNKNNFEYGGTVFRATFGKHYTLEQLAQSPLYFSKGCNGTGLYTAVNSIMGKSYIKYHLNNKFLPYEYNTGNILKIDVSDNAAIINKMQILKAQNKITDEILNTNIDKDLKKLFIDFFKLDVSIPAMFFGADLIYIPNGHIIILNKGVLMFPKKPEQLQNNNLQVNLEKFREKDSNELAKVDKFLQLEK